MINGLKAFARKIVSARNSERTSLPETSSNLVMLTYDSCRYDTMVQAKTPVLDRYSTVYKAYSPATYTYPAHLSFFCGILPGISEPIPYYNRFVKQLVALQGVGDGIVDTEKDENSIVIGNREHNIVSGLAKAGYYTVGSAGANWFAKEALQVGFQDFHFTSHAKAMVQIELILEAITKNSTGRPFFAFINFMETHTPYMHYGDDEYFMTARTKMSWPPAYKSTDDAYAETLHRAQISAAEHLDACLPSLFGQIPANTTVLLLGDHGEAFGEDGYWGHGIYHRVIMEVPISIFSLQNQS